MTQPTILFQEIRSFFILVELGYFVGGQNPSSLKQLTFYSHLISIWGQPKALHNTIFILGHKLPGSPHMKHCQLPEQSRRNGCESRNGS